MIDEFAKLKKIKELNLPNKYNNIINANGMIVL